MFNPITKIKEIVGIDIGVYKDNVRITYKVVNEGNYGEFSSHYKEDAITDYTEEKAMTIAKYYAEKGEEYYGN
jgi:bisphosphoglycerate-dependent phosphoglycerate mutase